MGCSLDRFPDRRLPLVHRWISADALREDPGALRPGMVVVWTRGEPGSW